MAELFKFFILPPVWIITMAVRLIYIYLIIMTIIRTIQIRSYVPIDARFSGVRVDRRKENISEEDPDRAGYYYRHITKRTIWVEDKINLYEYIVDGKQYVAESSDIKTNRTKVYYNKEQPTKHFIYADYRNIIRLTVIFTVVVPIANWIYNWVNSL